MCGEGIIKKLYFNKSIIKKIVARCIRSVIWCMQKLYMKRAYGEKKWHFHYMSAFYLRALRTQQDLPDF